MPEVISKTWQRLQDFWKNLDKSQKIRIYIIAGILLAAVIASTYLLTRTTYVPLFRTGIKDSAELGSMSKVLADGGIKNNITEDNNIEVDSKNKNKAEYMLVENNYPKSIDAIFAESYVDRVGMSSTESDKEAFKKDALERRLAAKLMAVDFIESATVTLAMPETDGFLFQGDDTEKPSAAVTVKPKIDLNKSQVSALVKLVSNSVPDLKPEAVSVMDVNKMLELTSQTSDPLVDKANDQLDIKKKVTAELESKIKKSLPASSAIYDNFTVAANPFIDFNKYSEKDKTVSLPDGMEEPAPISSSTTDIELKNGDPQEDVPGQDANPGTAPTYPIEGNGQNSEYTEKREDINYIYSQKESELEKSPEIIPEKTGVLLSLMYGERVEDVPDVEIANIRNAIATLVNIPLENVTVNKFKILPPPEVQTSVSDTISELVNDYGAFALVLFLAIGLVIAALPKRKREDELDADAEAELAPVTAAGPRFIVPEDTYEEIPEIGLEERSEVKKQIEKFVKQKPDAVAQLLRNWLSDEWDG